MNNTHQTVEASFTRDAYLQPTDLLPNAGVLEFAKTVCWFCGINREPELAPTEKLNAQPNTESC